jgi:hypothetical protein
MAIYFEKMTKKGLLTGKNLKNTLDRIKLINLTHNFFGEDNTWHILNQKSLKFCHKYYDTVGFYPDFSNNDDPYNIYKFRLCFNEYMKLTNAKFYDNGLEEFFFEFIKNNDEKHIKCAVEIILRLSTKKILGDEKYDKLKNIKLLKDASCFAKIINLLVDDLLSGANFDLIYNTCMINNEITFFEKMYTCFFEFSKIGKLNNEVISFLCDSPLVVTIINFIVNIITHHDNLQSKELLCGEFLSTFIRMVKGLKIKEKHTNNFNTMPYKLSNYMEIFFDINPAKILTNNIMQQWIKLPQEDFDSVWYAIFLLHNNKKLNEKNILYIMKNTKHAGFITEIHMALNKFKLLNKERKRIIEKNIKLISFDLTTIFADMAKFKYNEINTSIMENIFKHVFENLSTCRENAKDICGMIFYLQQAKLFTLNNVNLWLRYKCYHDSFWITSNFFENEVLGKDNYKQVLLLAKRTSESQEISSVIAYLFEVGSSWRRDVFDMLLKFNMTKLQRFCKVVAALQYNKMKNKINSKKGNQFPVNRKNITVLLTENNCLNLGKFLNFSDEICNVFRILASVKFLNQYILDFLFKYNAKKFRFTLEKLKDKLIQKQLQRISLVEDVEKLDLKIIDLQKLEIKYEKDIKEFNEVNKDIDKTNGQIMLEKKKQKNRLKEWLDKTREEIKKARKEAREMRVKIQEKIINIIKPITVKNPEKRKDEGSSVLENSKIIKNSEENPEENLEQKKKTNIIKPIKRAKIRGKFIFFRELGKLLYRLFCCCFCCFCCRKRKNRDGGNKLGKDNKNSYAKIVGKQTGGNKIPNTPKKKRVVIVIENPDKDKKKEIIKKNIVKKVTQTKIITPKETTPLLPGCSINNNQ